MYDFLINNKGIIIIYIVILFILYIVHRYWENNKIEKFNNTTIVNNNHIDNDNNSNDIILYFDGNINEILTLLYFLENKKRVRLLFKNKINTRLKDYYLNILKKVKDNYPSFSKLILVPYTIKENVMNNNIKFSENIKNLLHKKDIEFKELRDTILYKQNLIKLIDLYKYSLYHNTIVNLPVTRQLNKEKELIVYYKDNSMTHILFKRVKLITNINKIKKELSLSYKDIIRMNLSCNNINYKTGNRCKNCFKCKKYNSLQMEMKNM